MTLATVLDADKVYAGSGGAPSIQLLIHSLVKQCCAAAHLTASSPPNPDLMMPSGLGWGKSSNYVGVFTPLQCYGETLALGRSGCARQDV